MGAQRNSGRAGSNPNSKTNIGRGRPSRGALIVAAVGVAFLAGFIALVVLDSRQRAASGPPGGVEDVNAGPAGRHTEANVDYEQTPPAGGEHSDVWQNAGFYDAPIRDENAVHTLEHGAVWIAYSPDLPSDQKNQIRGLVEGQTCMLASPVEDLRAPVVASAWGKQLALDSAGSPDLERFVRAYRQGPQTPEVGATCTGGTADTV